MDEEIAALNSVEDAAETIFGLLGDDEGFPEDEALDEGEEGGEGDGDDEEEVDDETGEEVDEEDDDLEGEGDDSDDDGSDDADEDEGSGKPAKPTSKYKVTVDGEELEVTLEEALAGYQRTAAFTRKTQALAEERKQTQGERQKYIEQIATLGAAIAATIEPVEDWEALKASNPAKYATQWADFQRKQEQLKTLHEEQTRLVTQQRQELLEEGSKVLAKEIPGWADAEKGAELRANVARYAIEDIGITQEELETILDPRLFIVLHKAYQFDKAKAKGKAIVEAPKLKKKKAAPVLQPGVSKGTTTKGKADKAAKARLQKLQESGDVHDAAALIFDLLD